jgi:hypothetical protein
MPLVNVRIAVAGLVLALAGSSVTRAQPVATWTVTAAPTVRIAGGDTEASGQLAVVVGATRLPGGNLLVADRGEFNLFEFAPTGRLVRRFGRKGAGPGEMSYQAHLWRCGNRIVTYDIEGYRLSEFSLDGKFVRHFRWGTPERGNSPYHSACNAAGTFVHYGWELGIAEGVYRKPVPMWLSGSDSTVTKVFPSIPGSERWGTIGKGGGGSRPLPFGRQPMVAIGSNRVYVSTGERYEIKVFSLTGAPLPAITRNVPPVPVTKADIEAELEREISSSGEGARKRITADFAAMTLPKQLPPHGALVVDANDQLWVQDVPRGASPSVLWRIFDPAGRAVAQVTLPRALEIFEIGADFVLGRYLDENEGVPEVRLYGLRRNTGAPPR